jgi:hypothetical protein
MTTPIKKPVTLRSLTERINRKLRLGNKKLVKNAPRYRVEFGEFAIVDLNSNTLSDRHVNIPQLACQLGVFKDWEELGAKK